MKNIKSILTFLLGIFIVLGGVGHFVNPAMYLGFIPDFLPKTIILYASGVGEIFIGLCVFIPRLRSVGTLGILVLMLAFLPLHVADVFKDNPAIGSHQLALVRLPLQFVLIAWAWFIHKK